MSTVMDVNKPALRRLPVVAAALSLLLITPSISPAQASGKKRPAVAASKLRRQPRAAQKAPVGDPVALVKAGKKPAYWNPARLDLPPVISAPSAIVMDFDTGEVLWSVDAETKRYPASTTKILTALLFCEATEPADTVVCRNPYIGQVGESSLNIKPGEKFSAHDLLYGFLLRSANDGGVVIAEHVAGSVPAFAQKMNDRATQLGATHSHFMNPHGLHNPEHYTTAHDLAILARAALQNPKFADAVKIPVRKITRSINVRDNIVKAKSKKGFYDRLVGADGVKSGYTRPAGHCFVGSATRNGRRLIAVVMKAPSSACDDAAPLLAWAFARFPSVTLAEARQPLAQAAVTGGTAEAVDVVTETALRVPDDTLDRRSYRTETRLDAVQAPIERGQKVGELVALDGNREVSRVPLIATESVAASSAFVGAKSGGRTGWPWWLAGGGALALLIGYRHGTTAKGARRRRRRLPSKS